MDKTNWRTLDIPKTSNSYTTKYRLLINLENSWDGNKIKELNQSP